MERRVPAPWSRISLSNRAWDPCPMEEGNCPMEHGMHVIWGRGSLSYVLIHVPWSRRVPALHHPLQFPASGCPLRCGTGHGLQAPGLAAGPAPGPALPRALQPHGDPAWGPT